MAEKPNEIVEAYKKRISDLFKDLKVSETAKNSIGVEDEEDAVVNP